MFNRLTIYYLSILLLSGLVHAIPPQKSVLVAVNADAWPVNDDQRPLLNSEEWVNQSHILWEILPHDVLVQNQLVTEVSATQLHNLYSRLYALREGSRCIDTYTVNWREQLFPTYPFFTPDELCIGKVTVQELPRFGLFLNGHGNVGTETTTTSMTGFDFDSRTLTLGLDYRATDKFLVGSAVGYTQAQADFTGLNGSVDMTGYSLSVYSLLYEADKFYLDTVYSYAWYSDDSYRSVNDSLVNAMDSTIIAQITGNQQALSLGLGHHFHHKRFTLTPLLRLDYMKRVTHDVNEELVHTETESATLLMRVDSQNQERIWLRVGSDFSYTGLVKWGLIIPQLRLHAVRELTAENQAIKVTLVQGIRRQPLLLQIDKPDGTHFTLGLGVLAQFARDKMLYVDYETVLNWDNIKRHSLTAGVRFAF